MHITRHARGSVAAVIGAIATMVLAVGAVAAHGQTVDPNGAGAGFTRPISKVWAQAHCHAQAPMVVSEASAGVNVTTPSDASETTMGA